MKFLAICAAVLPATLGATCGNVEYGSSRPKVYVCEDGLVYNPEAANAVCGARGCNSAVCCVEVAETGEGAAEVDVLDPEERTCGNAIFGSRESSHTCPAGYQFNQAKYYEPCGDMCTDELCCVEDTRPNPWDCFSDEEFSSPKRSYCCITQRIGCAQKTCAFGAGILSEDGGTCCHVSCGTCGGEGCFYKGGPQCCKSLIAGMGRPCSLYSAPCTMEWDMSFRRSSPAMLLPVPIQHYTQVAFPVAMPQSFHMELKAQMATNPAPHAMYLCHNQGLNSLLGPSYPHHASSNPFAKNGPNGVAFPLHC